jgi:hypothetical protein
MNSIEQSTNHRVTSWRDGCAAPNSRDEHLRDGISRGSKFAQGGESELDNYLPIFATPL